MKRNHKLILFIAFILAFSGLPFLGQEAAGDAGSAGEGVSKPNTRQESRNIASGLKRIAISPQDLKLSGARARATLIVTGTYQDGTERDLTRWAKFSLNNARVARIDAQGRVSVTGNGEAIVRAELDGKRAQTRLSIRAADQGAAVHFANDLLPLFTRVGCNNGSCHGALNGQNGFKLSLFGYDAEADYQMIVKDAGGRRINLENPEQSLLLLKPTFAMAHGGGLRFENGSLEYHAVRQWIQAGAPFDSRSPRIERVSVLPSERVLVGRGQQQQLVVLGHLSDGTVKDLTRDVKYISNDEGIATVDAQGEVTAQRSGETAVMARALGQVALARVMVIASPPLRNYPAIPANNYIDELVSAKLRRLNIVPSSLCTDSDFVRRAYLDTVGRLPSLEEVRHFLNDADPDKRLRLIDALLERPEYADYWAVIWGDLLRNSRRYVLEKGSLAFHRWIRDSMAANKPYDQFVRELLTANGSGFRAGPPNYYRVSTNAEDLAITTSQLFLGVRIDCARCHSHPLEKWTQDDFYGLAAFFTRVRRKGSEQLNESVIYTVSKGELNHPKTKKPVNPKFLGAGAIASAGATRDRRALLADWLAAPDNPYFAQATVNRLWRHFMGRGVVDPVDDFRATNPPSNAPLLEALARDFVAGKYDIKRMMRIILNSRAYQLSAEINATNAEDTTQFSRRYLKKLTAEQLLDAITQVTGVDEKFGGHVLGTSAMQLSDPSINSYFLKTFGRPNRDIICERSQEPSLSQALHMISGGTLNNKISAKNNRLDSWIKEKKSDREIIESLYLATLSRPPDSGEHRQVERYLTQAPSKRAVFEDLLWALVNSKEFNTNH